jgi:flagellin
MEQAMERLSSGKRINSAMDDAAGLSISHSLDSKITGLNQAVRNANDGVAMVNLAEGAMEEISSMLTRMNELATQASNGTYNSDDLTNLQLEFQALSDEITRVSEATDFNGVALLNSTATKALQVGDSSGDTISVTFQQTSSTQIGATTTSVTQVTTPASVTDTLAATAATTGATPNHASAAVDIGTSAQVDVSQLTVADATAAVASTAANAAHDGETVVFQIDVNGTTYEQEWIAGASDAVGVEATLYSLATQINNDQGGTFTAITLNEAGTAGATHDTLKITAKNDTNSYSVGPVKIVTRAEVAEVTATVNTTTHLSDADISTTSGASAALATISQAMQDVDSYRSDLGAVANRLEHASANLMSRVEHQSAARSRIEDADYAVESANLAKAQVLQQAGTAMLSQANASTQNVLSLLK